MKFILIFLLALSHSALALDCPLGKNEDHLTFARVMRNFGRFTLDAQSVAIKGVNPNEVVTNEELALGVTKLNTAIDCNTIILEDHQTGNLRPDKISKLSESERAEYLIHFYAYLTEFKVTLIDLQNTLSDFLKLDPSQRDYKLLKAKSDEVDRVADQAHKFLE